mmetsp:Transcript_7523/g.21973  ORF Transcript_7523/g.21973 Transcript_7523/m.21973 type:complete len:119 (+) Transcript_7523:444-800(+)
MSGTDCSHETEERSGKSSKRSPGWGTPPCTPTETAFWAWKTKNSYPKVGASKERPICKLRCVVLCFADVLRRGWNDIRVDYKLPNIAQNVVVVLENANRHNSYVTSHNTAIHTTKTVS